MQTDAKLATELNRGMRKRHAKLSFLRHEPFGETMAISRFRLGNGLQILLLPDPSVPVVSYHSWFRVGSRHEEHGKTGLAHLFEHLMFGETDNLPHGEFDRRLELAGADNNAATWTDWTSYHENLPADKLELAIQLESERMQHLVLRDPQVASEKEVVANERRYRVDDDIGGLANEWLYRTAFKKHPYHWPTIGWMRDIQNFTTDDCRAFYKRYYAPNNATIVLVGAFEPKQALSMIQAYYGHLSPSRLAAHETVNEPSQRRERKVTLNQPTSTEKMEIGYKAPAFGEFDWAVMQVIAELLSGGKSSRLVRRLVLEEEIATEVHGSVAPFADPGLFEVWISARAGVRTKTLMHAFDEEVARLQKDLVSEEELEKAKNTLELGFVHGLETASGKADQIGFFDAVLGDAGRVFGRLDEYRRTSPADILRVAREYLKSSRRTCVEILPKKSTRKRAAKKGGVMKSRFRGTTHNGLRILLESHHALPLVDIDLVICTGSAGDPVGKEGLTRLAWQMVRMGTRGESRHEVEAAIAALGANIGIETGANYTRIHGSVIRRNAEPLFALIADLLTQPAFRNADFQQLKRETRAGLIAMRDEDRELAGMHFRRFLYEDHVYGRPSTGWVKTVKRISLKEVKARFEQSAHASNMILGVAGAMDADELSRLAEQYFGGIAHGKKFHDKVGAPKLAKGRRILLIDKPERTQTQIFVGALGGKIGDTDDAEMICANTSFGGTFASRLMQEVRAKRGWSYGAYSRLNFDRQRDTWHMWTFPSSRDAADCIALEFELLESMASRGATAAEHRLAKSYLVNSHCFEIDTPSKRLEQWMDTELLGLPEDFFETRVKRVGRVSRKHAHQAFKKRINPKNLAITVVATASELAPRLEKLPGITSLEVVPYNGL